MKYFETSLMPQVNFLEENIHYAQDRYLFASSFCQSKTVLDAGCGTGYGANVLSKKAKKVYGLDKNHGVIEYARETFRRQNLTFQEENLEELGFSNNYFDLVCAFEVIEHIKDYRAVMKEFYRILKPGGILLISTPNKAVYSPYTKKPFYPFHFYEFTLSEFKKILGSFQIKKILGQKGKKILYPRWHPRSLIKIIYTGLPQWVKKMILRCYLDLKVKHNQSIKNFQKIEYSNLQEARIFIAVCQKEKR